MPPSSIVVGIDGEDATRYGRSRLQARLAMRPLTLQLKPLVEAAGSTSGRSLLVQEMKSRHFLGPTFPCPKHQPVGRFGRDLDQSTRLVELVRLVQVPSKSYVGLIFGARKGGSREVAALHFVHQYCSHAGRRGNAIRLLMRTSALKRRSQ